MKGKANKRESKADWNARVSVASHTFAHSLGVPEPVLQCTYISVQIEQLISGLDRPPQAVLESLIEANLALRCAGKQLELDQP